MIGNDAIAIPSSQIVAWSSLRLVENDEMEVGNIDL